MNLSFHQHPAPSIQRSKAVFASEGPEYHRVQPLNFFRIFGGVS
jgi:hypothetical protein